ncbi:MAG TPA: hypothetical protein VNX46_14825 [Candidatus Acidoferrum sp.]|nr:hypothetical protein [Candidatus Acidoferrum sp.]
MTKESQEAFQNIETVSFDILDTLLHRLLAAPVDLFDAVRSKLMTHSTALVEQNVIVNFPHYRRLAEQQARERRMKTSGGEGEVTYAEIYDEFQQLTNASKGCVDLLSGAELELEALFFYRSEAGFSLYEQAVNEGRRVLFISDMYLPKNFLVKVLQNFGYKAASQETVFVSGELRISKHSGALFKQVQQMLNLSADRWLHIGDNPGADVERPKSLGIRTLHADWAFVENVPGKHQYFGDALARSLLAGMQLPQYRSLYRAQDRYEYMGYTVFGPLLFGFYAWLALKMKEFKTDKILFLARDGRIIQRFHEVITQNSTLRISQQSDYVYISRKAIYPQGFTGIDLDKLYWVSLGKSNKNVATAIRDLNLDAHCLASHLEQTGLELGQDVASPEQREQWVHFLRKSFSSLLEMSRKERAAWGGYFTQFTKGAKRIAFVDLGWHGNLQANLLRALNDDCGTREYKGFYMGLSHKSKLNLGPYVKMEGWIVNPHDDSPHNARAQMLWSGGIELLEFAFTSNHGSTAGYRRDERGNIEPILESKAPSEQHYERCAMAIQAGVLEFAKRYAFLFDHFPVDALQSTVWQDNFFRLVDQPTDEQIDLFADLTHSDAPGSNTDRIPLAKQLGLWARITRGRGYQRERERAFWKRAFDARNYRSFLNRRYLKRFYNHRIRPYFQRKPLGQSRNCR